VGPDVLQLVDEGEPKKNELGWVLMAHLMAIILATLEADIRRILVEGQSGKIVQETPSPKITQAKLNETLSSNSIKRKKEQRMS
jgi:hypothetical protein